MLLAEGCEGVLDGGTVIAALNLVLESKHRSGSTRASLGPAVRRSTLAFHRDAGRKSVPRLPVLGQAAGNVVPHPSSGQETGVDRDAHSRADPIWRGRIQRRRGRTDCNRTGEQEPVHFGLRRRRCAWLLCVAPLAWQAGSQGEITLIS